MKSGLKLDVLSSVGSMSSRYSSSGPIATLRLVVPGLR